MAESSSSNNKMIPDKAMEAVRKTSANIEEVKANLQEFLSHCTTEALSTMDPLDRAHALFLIAKANTILFAVRLRCNGAYTEDHKINEELERLSVYEKKMQLHMDLKKAPLRPSATINSQAAARFIEHSLPDLSSEQKQSMREISRGGEGNNRYKYVDRNVHKKRKYQSSENQPSVRYAAQEFLEKAARELLGDNKNGVKGPLQRQEDSDDDVIVLD